MLRRSIVGRIKRLHSQPQVYFTAIGKVPSNPKRDRPFEPGQFFIARDYEYRGIVLLPQQVETVSDDDSNGNIEMAYLTLCDERDTGCEERNIDYIEHYMEDGTIRATQNIDIIPHSHVLPITHIELLTAFQHNLFSLYFKQGSPNSLWSGFKPSDQDQSDPRESLLKTLNTLGNPNSTRDDWNRKFLKPKADLYTYMDQRSRKLKKYVKTTENIRITVIPFFLGSGRTADRRVSGGERYDPGDFLHSTNWWQYTVTMENLNSEPFELIERQFKILDRQRGGSIKSVRGRGVVGKHPIITNDMPFKYTSTMPLPADGKSSGSCWGRYIFESRLDGRALTVEIPKFELSPEIEHAEPSDD